MAESRHFHVFFKLLFLNKKSDCKAFRTALVKRCPAVPQETASQLSPGLFLWKTTMRKALIAIAATLVATTSVFAAEMQATVSEIQADTHTIVLDDGTSLVVADGVDYSSIEAGDNVTIITDDASGQITEIMAAE